MLRAVTDEDDVDPRLVAHLRAHPAAMAAIDALADRYGQSLQMGLPAPGQGVPVGHVVVWYAVSREPLAAVDPDGTVHMMLEDEN